jgi:NAD(P)-dependent dehydrogenase (short-subunit alcohol dehydrogenase family)
MIEKFRLDGRVAVITGGAGLLGVKHAEAIASAGCVPVLWDVDEPAAHHAAEQIQQRHRVPARATRVDITSPESVARGTSGVLAALGRVDILINNAANNPKVESGAGMSGPASRLEHFALDRWNADIAVGLTGAFLCAQSLGTVMAERGKGVIVNVASDLALIGPDQRIYRSTKDDRPDAPVKPVTYSVVKSGLIGLTRYLATYWAHRGVRVNAICPGGVSNGQDDAFVSRLTNLIPMGRMATADEYQAAVVFLCSDASAYMTGASLVIDGGRTAW